MRERPRLRPCLAAPADACPISVTCARGRRSCRSRLPHTVPPGETLWSIAAANNFTTQTIAAFNGLSVDFPGLHGQDDPDTDRGRGRAALASAATASGPPTPSSGNRRSPRNGLAPPAADNGLPRRACVRPRRSSRPPARPRPASSSDLAHLLPFLPVGPGLPGVERGRRLGRDAPGGRCGLYGIDLYPGGPFSAYRSYAQQLYLYNLYLSGQGSLAAAAGDLLPRVWLRARPRRPVDASRGRPDRGQLRLGEDRGARRVVARQLRRARRQARRLRAQPTPAGTSSSRTWTRGRIRSTSLRIEIAGAEVLGRLGAAGDPVGEALARRAALVARRHVAGQEAVARADPRDRLERLRSRSRSGAGRARRRRSRRIPPRA